MRTVQFPVYPSREDNLFWLVHICPNRRSMLRQFKRRNKRKYRGERFAACVLPLPRQKVVLNGKRITSPLLGYVFFELGTFGPEPLAHEAVHMATGYLRRKRATLKLGRHADKREESLAYPVGYCAYQIMRQIAKRNLL
jgi:hypothetical protein